jgi:hypothetical protein
VNKNRTKRDKKTMVSCNDIMQTRDFNLERQRTNNQDTCPACPPRPCHVPILADKPLHEFGSATALSSNVGRIGGGEDLEAFLPGSQYVIFQG